MKIKNITIQPADRSNGSIPQPFHIQNDGLVSNQDYWQGSPSKLIGFSTTSEKGNITGALHFEEFWKNPSYAKGLYPIFEHSDKEWHIYQDQISRVIIN